MYEDIVEVVEVGMHWANHYLDHGYRLMDIQTGTRAGMFPAHAANAGQAFVRRNPVYVLGRPKGVGWVAPPPQRRPAAAEAWAIAGPAEKPPEAGASVQAEEVVN